MKTQATKASDAQVRLHIARQRELGENMIPGADMPHWSELAITAALVLAVLFAHSRGWM
jgi:hypothetical protein